MGTYSNGFTCRVETVVTALARLNIDLPQLLLHAAELAQDFLLRGQHLRVRVILPRVEARRHDAFTLIKLISNSFLISK